MTRPALAWIAGLAALALAATLYSDRPAAVRTTDHRVRYNAKEAKDEVVEMSCRSMPVQEKFGNRGIFGDNTHVLFLTAGVELPVYLDRSNKEAVKLLKALTPGSPITVYGKVHLGQGEIVPYVVAHNVREGATSDPDSDLPKPVIINLYVGTGADPQKFTMERGKDYTFQSPLNNETITVKWDY